MAKKTQSSNPSKSALLKQAEAKAEQIVAQKEKEKNKDKSKPKAKKQNGVVKYFKELKSEFKKVVWPSRKAVLNNTGVVLAVVCVAALVVWGIDSGFTALLKLFIDNVAA